MIIENDKKLKIKGIMKPTICLKIFSFSVGDIMSTAVNFICSKISLELFISVKHNWIWKQKSNIGVILKGEPESCDSASCKSMSWEPMSLQVASHINLHIDSRIQMRENKNN